MERNNNDTFLKFNKILVALDASPQSISALETAARLAHYMRARLTGLFVEDVNILKLCDSPLAREFCLFTFRSIPVQRHRIEYQLRTIAEKINQKIAEISSRLRIPWNFTVTRGWVSSEILSASEEADLVILGKSGWSSKGISHLGSTAQDIIFKSKKNILILGKKPPKGAPIFLFYFNTPLFKKAFNLALFIKREEFSQLVILIPVKKLEYGIEIRNQLREKLGDLFDNVYFRILEVEDPSDFAYESSILKEGWFIIPWDRNIIDEEVLKNIISKAKGSILVIKN